MRTASSRASIAAGLGLGIPCIISTRPNYPAFSPIGETMESIQPLPGDRRAGAFAYAAGAVGRAAAVMAAGSVTFLAGAFMPISRVFIENDPQLILAVLQADPVQWKAEQFFFAAGTAALPVGVVMLARGWDSGWEGADRNPLAGQRLAKSAALLLVSGAGLFLVALEARYRDPEAFALGNLPSWPSHGYMWLSLAGMAALGGGLLDRKSVV